MIAGMGDAGHWRDRQRYLAANQQEGYGEVRHALWNWSIYRLLQPTTATYVLITGAITKRELILSHKTHLSKCKTLYRSALRARHISQPGLAATVTSKAAARQLWLSGLRVRRERDMQDSTAGTLSRGMHAIPVCLSPKRLNTESESRGESQILERQLLCQHTHCHRNAAAL